LPHHGDLHTVLGGDEVRLVVEALIELHPVHGTGESAGLGCVVVAYRRGVIAADVEGLVPGEEHWDAGFLPGRTDLVSIDEEHGVAALGETIAVVCELDADLVRALGQRLSSGRLDQGQPQEVVAVGRDTVDQVEGPASEGPPCAAMTPLARSSVTATSAVMAYDLFFMFSTVFSVTRDMPPKNTWDGPLANSDDRRFPS
jgi:hypothetical protein